MAETSDSRMPEVVNNETAKRFETQVEGHRAILTYRVFRNEIFLTHTEVPPDIEVRGVGSRLAHDALEYARSSHLQVVPVCPFVADYIGKHPEYQALVSPSGRASSASRDLIESSE